MIAYIFYSSIWLNPSFVWYIFYLSNLLIYHFNEIPFKSWRFWSFFTLQPIILFSIFLRNPSDLSYLIFLIATFLFADLLTFGLYRMQVAELLQEEKRKQNAQLNLFLAENERNRIGRDLHEISKQSMADVRRIIDNLKTRTLDEELVTIQAMLEMSGIRVQVQHQLNIASIAPNIQSSLSMVLLELATNIIKHAQASSCQIHLYFEKNRLIADVEDNGKGFKIATGKELHSIRERVESLSGQVEILSCKQPTKINLPMEGFK